MKKSTFVKLVLVSSVAASCSQEPKRDEWTSDTGKKVYMRSDTTASYARTRSYLGTALFFYAFRPFGSFSNGIYSRSGYYSNGINHNANIGRNVGKSSLVSRGGFGSSSRAVSS